jgi:hypothetical protein
MFSCSDVQFESRQGHLLSWLKSVLVFLRDSTLRIPRQLLTNPYSSLSSNHTTRCAVLDDERLVRQPATSEAGCLPVGLWACIWEVPGSNLAVHELPYFSVDNARVIYTKQLWIRKKWTCAVYIRKVRARYLKKSSEFVKNEHARYTLERYER